MKGLDLFSGIGLFSLGMEEAGVETVAACEFADWKRLIHEELCGKMPMWHDIRDMRGSEVIERAGPIDIVFGSPPCTDASLANTNGQGIYGAETGLFVEAVRIIREIRPRWVVLENTPGLTNRGADGVYTDLERAGYAVWPLVVGADNLGAPHIRKRVWIVGYHADADSDSGNGKAWRVGMGGECEPAGETEDLGLRAKPAGEQVGRGGQPRQANVANPHGQRRQHAGGRGQRGDISSAQALHVAHDARDGRRAGRQGRSDPSGEGQPEQALQGVAEPSGTGLAFWQSLAGDHGPQLAALERDIGTAIHDWAGGLGRYLRVADGCPAKTAKMLMSACGDGVVVEVAAAIGRAIRQAEGQLNA